MYTLLIADDEPLERQALRLIIKKKYPNIQIVGEVGDGNSAIQIATSKKPDIVLMDIRMPEMDGLEAARQIKMLLPEMVIIMLTALDEFRCAKQALSIGAAEYLLKPVRPDEIISTLELVVEKINVRKNKMQEEMEWRSNRANTNMTDPQTFAKQLVFSKDDSFEPCGATFNYPFAYERILLHEIRCGERAQAKEALQKLLNTIVVDKAEIDIVKAYVLELLILVSRAATEGGAAIEQLMLLNCNCTERLNECHTTAQVTVWMFESLDCFMDNMLKTRMSMNLRVINKACDYIIKNFYKNISLEEVAQTVHLSAFYFSRLFKQEKGYNFVDFLTNVRMEHAKKLLKNHEFTAVRIAAEVGYQDASYFSRVFRQIVGMTPNQYRNEMGCMKAK